MCTVIVHVPSDGEPVRLIAVRDEDPARPWDALGPWWPEEYPGVVGVRDRRAGGAWLAADATRGRLAVLLNRLDLSSRRDDEVTTRGSVALDAVAGRPPAQHPAMRGFNLVDVSRDAVRVVSWDGIERRETTLGPGTHMIAHDDVDDPDTARVSRWLDDFRARVPEGGVDWYEPWMAVIARTATLPGDDPAAIIRDQSFEGVRSASLLLCVATVGEAEFDVRYGALDHAGSWAPVDLQPPLPAV